jgi:phosphoribosylformylglycinamidine synthase I
MRSAVIVFPGTNRERDVARAIERASGDKPLFVWHGDTTLPPVDLVVLPGGFSYGDYLRSGAIAARAPIMPEVVKAAKNGVLVLGICNGFQILTEAGLLPGALMRNATLNFICREAHSRVETIRSSFTHAYEKGQVIRVPVAHHDGNYFADEDTLDRLEDEDRVAFRYCGPNGEIAPEYNPNGSQRAIAGILSARRNVLGLMPHPENMIEEALGGLDGLGLFTSISEVAA